MKIFKSYNHYSMFCDSADVLINKTIFDNNFIGDENDFQLISEIIANLKIQTKKKKKLKWFLPIFWLPLISKFPKLISREPNNSTEIPSIPNEKRIFLHRDKIQTKYMFRNTVLFLSTTMTAIAAAHIFPTIIKHYSGTHLEETIWSGNVTKNLGHEFDLEIDKINNQLSEQQKEIDKLGEQLLENMDETKETLPEIIKKLKQKLQESNIKGSDFEISEDLSSKLIQKINDQKNQLLEGYKKQIFETVKKEIQGIKNQLNEIFNNKQFKHLDEKTQKNFHQQIKQLEQEIEKDLEEFIQRLENAVNEYEKEAVLSIKNFQGKLTIDDIDEILNITSDELNQFIFTLANQNQEILGKKMSLRKTQITKDLITKISSHNNEEWRKYIQNSKLSPESKKIVEKYLQIKTSEEDINETDQKTEEAKEKQRQQAEAEKQRLLEELKVIEKEQQRIASERERIFESDGYKWCNDAFWKHLITAFGCSGWTLGANIDAAMNYVPVDWSGIFNIVSSVVLVAEIATICSGVGALAILAKTSLKTAAKLALKTTAATATMAGAGAYFGHVSEDFDVTQGAIMGASIGFAFTIGAGTASTIAAKQIVKKSIAQTAKKIMIDGFRQTLKTAAKKSLQNAGIIAKSAIKSQIKTGIGAGIGAGVSAAAGQDVAKGAMAGIMLSGPITKVLKPTFNRVITNELSSKIQQSTAKKILTGASSKLNKHLLNTTTSSSASNSIANLKS